MLQECGGVTCYNELIIFQSVTNLGEKLGTGPAKFKKIARKIKNISPQGQIKTVIKTVIDITRKVIWK